MEWARLSRSVGSVLLLAVAMGLLLMWGDGDSAHGAPPLHDECICSPDTTERVNPCADRDPCEGACLEIGPDGIYDGVCIGSPGNCYCHAVPEALKPCADRDPCDGACLETICNEWVIRGECKWGHPQECRDVGGSFEVLVDGSDVPASATEASGSSSPPYAVIAGAAAAAAVALTTGAWYARRRWMR